MYCSAELKMNHVVIFVLLFGIFILTNAIDLGIVPSKFWFFEDKEIMFTCMALNTGTQNGYSILWSMDDARLSNTSDDILITNSQSGTNITSTIVLRNASKYDSKPLLFVQCELNLNGDTIESRNLKFRVIRNKDLPNVTVSTKKNKVEVGDGITLLCNARGKIGIYKLDITWSKDGKVLKHMQQTSAGEAINLIYNITQATGSIGGIYKCRANVTAQGKLFEVSDAISLSVIPKLIGQKRKSSYSLLGGTVNVQCDIDGYPLNITWQKKSSDGTTRVISDGSRFKIVDNGRTLTISTFQSDDATDFYCKNMDGGKEIVQTFTFIEQVPPSIKNSSKIKNVILIPGRPMVLKCEVSADPSCISWSTYDPDKGEKRDVADIDIPGIFRPTRCNNTLWFKNVSEVLNGQKFSCADGNVTQTFTVIKMTKPRLTGPSPKEIEAEEGDDVTLKCDIEVIPLIVTWMVDGHFLNVSIDSKYVITSDDPRVLVMADVEYDDGGSFYCSAKNALDKKGVRQEIILVLNDPLEVLWIIVGIVIAVLLIAVIIGIAVYCKIRRDSHDVTEEPQQLSERNGGKTDGGEEALLSNPEDH